MRLCPLCGLEFSETEARRPCHSCPLDTHCSLICCPNCGYQTPEEPQWLVGLQRWWQNRKAAQTVRAAALTSLPARALAMLDPGDMVEIVELASEDDMTLRRLTSLGLLPGVQLTLLRSFPCYLLQVGHAQIALDQQLASLIIVRVAS